MSTLTNDVNAVNNLISNRIIQFISDLISVAGALVGMLVLSFKLSLVIIVVLLLGGPIFLFIGKKSSDALYLKGSEAGVIDRHQGLRKKRVIPLSDFRGWPDGELFNDLMRYIPDIIQENHIIS